MPAKNRGGFHVRSYYEPQLVIDDTRDGSVIRIYALPDGYVLSKSRSSKPRNYYYGPAIVVETKRQDIRHCEAFSVDSSALWDWIGHLIANGQGSLKIRVHKRVS